MKQMLKFGAGSISIMMLVLLAAIQSPTVQDWLIDREIATRMPLGDIPEQGLHVFLCGTGSPLPSLKRAQNCTAIIADGRVLMFDAGTGSWEVLQDAGINASNLEAVFLTHFHSDHIGDLGEANLGSWVAGREGRLSVYGPAGVADIVDGVNLTFARDNAFRTAHHGKGIAPPRNAGLTAHEFPGDGIELVYDKAGLKVYAFPVRHEPVMPAVGYRIEYEGSSVVISGDTARSATLIDAARGANLLIHEAQANHIVEKIGRAAAQRGDARLAKIMSDIPSYHTSPVEAAEIANEAGVNRLVLSHLTPAPDNGIAKKIFLRGVAKTRRDVILGEDGMLLTLGSDGELKISRR